MSILHFIGATGLCGHNKDGIIQFIQDIAFLIPIPILFIFSPVHYTVIQAQHHPSCIGGTLDRET